jgi:hypothetical protein
MTESVTLKTVGDWSAQIEVPLSNALSASVELLGWSGYKACEKAIVYMAKSSAKLTHASAKRRPIVENPYLIGADGKKNRRAKDAAKWGYYSYSSGQKKFVPIMGVQYAPWFIQFKSATTGEMLMKNLRTGKVHRYRGGEKGSIVTSKSEAAKDGRLVIRNSGLAKRSWMWNIKGFHDRKQIPGVQDVQTILGANECGLLLTNRLSYMTKITPPNLQEEVARRASSSIMHQAASELERKFSVEVPRLARSRKIKATIARLETEFGNARKRSAA